MTADIAAADPDFIVNMGDLLDYHLFGFNDPPPDSAWARLAYLNYRRMMGDTLRRAAHFPVIGNWDGETGCNTDGGDRALAQPAPALRPGAGRRARTRKAAAQRRTTTRSRGATRCSSC